MVKSVRKNKVKEINYLISLAKTNGFHATDNGQNIVFLVKDTDYTDCKKKTCPTCGNHTRSGQPKYFKSLKICTLNNLIYSADKSRSNGDRDESMNLEEAIKHLELNSDGESEKKFR